MSASFERRQFIKLASLLTGGAAALTQASSVAAATAAATAPAAGGRAAAPPQGETPLQWLEGQPASFGGATWGVPWPQGRIARDAGFELRGADSGAPAQPVQSWPLAYWPDG